MDLSAQAWAVALAGRRRALRTAAQFTCGANSSQVTGCTALRHANSISGHLCTGIGRSPLQIWLT